MDYVALLDRGEPDLEIFGLAMRVCMGIPVLDARELGEIRRIDSAVRERERSRRVSP